MDIESPSWLLLSADFKKPLVPSVAGPAYAGPAFSFLAARDILSGNDDRRSTSS